MRLNIDSSVTNAAASSVRESTMGAIDRNNKPKVPSRLSEATPSTSSILAGQHVLPRVSCSQRVSQWR